ncbi:WD40 domain protein beta Propeller [Chloroherpeton thalassium ATCC 35110]|uniref:WD40 domain protein beta Propeller n=1 Tax=Chloroherpeton thalassium (strain ATCC 35110 / GB-78) TaxID=517418 RepID=B3QYB1_CHLT3|nr:peptidase MA family metallohydrolase [Chloroherpeton thalassium]ACF15077.1 WD40 domain protein beta Propeller [Chloroherpeton thalassium ATCC 35110]
MRSFSHFKHLLFSVVFFLLAGVLLPEPSFAQYFSFGKNKVQYTTFDWKYIQSEHFDVYFSDDGKYLAEFTAEAAEAAYQSIRRSFRYDINNRISIIVYKSHNDFQQNNVIKQYLSEGIGGVTELYKNRVVLPFEGDYRNFRHVIHHELVHAVINDMIYGGSVQNAIVNNIRAQIPLWFNEGIAEYESLEWDTNSDMFVSDAILNNYMPEISGLSGYFAYRGGQSVFRYISERYGEQKIGEIMQRLRATRNVEAAFKGAIGLSVEELSKKWVHDLKVMYWPEIAQREELESDFVKLTDHKEDGSGYNTSPSISPQGDKFAFITDRNGYFDIYIGSTIKKDEFEKIVSGQDALDFEELKILTPAITWSPDGKKIAIATKAGSSDAIMLIDVESHDTKKITFNLDGIFSVDWSPDGKMLCFIGNKTYKSDVYIYDLESKTLQNLTNDVFSDSDPSWSPDGQKIFFVSDRTNHLNVKPIAVETDTSRAVRFTREETFDMTNYDYFQKDVYELSLGKSSLRRLTATSAIDESSPIVSPDGKTLLFVSDLNGIYNVYKLDLTDPGLKNTPLPEPKLEPVTNLLTGIRQISLSEDGTKLLGVGLDYAGYDIVMLRMPFQKEIEAEHLDKEGELLKTTWGTHMQEVQNQKFKDATGRTSYGEHLILPKPTIAIHYTTPAIDQSTDSTKSSAADSAQTAKDEKDKNAPYENVSIDLRNFVFDKDFVSGMDKEKEDQQKKKEPEKPKFESYLDEAGEYRVRKYKLSFTPDIVYGNAQYDALYGARGAAVFAFSDLMGDHNLTIFTNLQLDLQNSDYGLSYYYLPNRINYGLSAFHQARFLGITNDEDYVEYYRYRTYGAALITSLPLNRFKRLEFSLGFITLSKENLESDNGNERVSFLYPSLSFIHDNTLAWLYAPISGTRYGLSFSGTYGSKIQFGTLLGDYRSYFRFWDYYSFVMRFSGAYSFGKTPQKFFIGGTQNWINRKFEDDSIPIDEIQDFVFTTPAVPLRGFNYNALNGNRFALVNLELRYPFLQYLAVGPIPIPFYYVEGVIFNDFGTAWTNNDFRGTARNANGDLRLNDLLWGYGWGIRTVFFYFILRFDMAWANDWGGSSKPKYHVSIGSDF